VIVEAEAGRIVSFDSKQLKKMRFAIDLSVVGRVISESRKKNQNGHQWMFAWQSDEK
jgi:hypothetical protein